MLAFYKPNEKNNGISISFRASDREKCLFLQFLKQASWNPDAQTGSFSENKRLPGKELIIRISQVEAASIIDAIERYVTFDTSHDFERKSVQFFFGPCSDHNKGEFCCGANLNNQQIGVRAAFLFPASSGEARLIKEYLVHFLNKSFAIKEKEDKPVDLINSNSTESSKPASKLEEQLQKDFPQNTEQQPEEVLEEINQSTQNPNSETQSDDNW